MRLNQNVSLLGKKVVLVPYTAEHVPRYHEWMKSEELQRLTASEPLTLEQEYAMQRSWREDADKCTFIVLDAAKWQAQPGSAEESCMAGDVNLFLTDLGDPTLGEIEVMIAEPSCRGKGFGTEAALMMMSYGKEVRADSGERWPGRRRGLVHVGSEPSSGLRCRRGSGEDTAHGDRWAGGVGGPFTLQLVPFWSPLGGVTKLGLTKFEAKIGQGNEPSIRMFQKLHFEQVAVSSVFQEVTLRLAMTEPERQWLLEQTSHVEEKPYRDGS